MFTVAGVKLVKKTMPMNSWADLSVPECYVLLFWGLRVGRTGGVGCCLPIGLVVSGGEGCREKVCVCRDSFHSGFVVVPRRCPDAAALPRPHHDDAAYSLSVSFPEGMSPIPLSGMFCGADMSVTSKGLAMAYRAACSAMRRLVSVTGVVYEPVAVLVTL